MAVAWVLLALVDPSVWTAAGLATTAVAVLLAATVRPIPAAAARLVSAPSRGAFVAACAAAAAGVSAWLAVRGLRGTPLSIDAGVSLMQARAMAHLHFGMPMPAPRQAFSNRFCMEGPDGLLYGIFPPGWPLAIVPFLWAGAPMLAGPAVAALLVVGQAMLGRAVGRAAGDEDGGELATRASLLVSLPSYARAIETSDLVSHGFVAALAAVAVACAIDTRRDARARTRRGLLMGACVGWALASRLLDGVVLGVAAAGVAVWTRPGRRSLVWAAAGAAPLLLLLLVEQRAATGQWLVPTQASYFARSDWPPTCHRLGFGPDVGCTVEHPSNVAAFGPGGYGVAAALRVARERASVLGTDLLGFAPLSLLVFVPVLAAGGVEALSAALLLALTLAYASFYNGNAPLYGARHLFPVAPFVWLAAVRGAERCFEWRSGAAARGAGAVVVLAVAGIGARGSWASRGREAIEMQANRSDLRRALEVRGVARGILKTRDHTEVAAAFDPWRDGDDRLFLFDDGSGLLDVRRAHPDLPMFLALPGDGLGALAVPTPPPGLRFELERAWPSLVRPHGLGASRAWRADASGGAALRLGHAQPGAEVTLPFEVVAAGDYVVHLDGLTGPDQGEYALVLDGSSLGTWRGYAAESAPRRGAPVTRALSAGRHALVARCLGRDPASSGYDALLDVLAGEPVATGGP
jgi:hypothetical protein